MKKIILLLFTLTLIFFSSCSLFRTPLSRASIGDKCHLDVKIFQALNSREALATGYDKNNIVVKLITTQDAFFDGKALSGDYIMVDTYTYESKQEITKTVPVFIKASEYDSAPKPLESKEEPKGQKL